MTAINTTTIHTFLVDDHALFRTGLKQYLKKKPYLAIDGEAANGQDALDMLREQQYDVVVLDVNMPVMDGYELVRHLHEEDLGVKKVVLSSYYHPASIYKMLFLGIDAFLSKEDELEDVVEAIREVAEGKSGILSKSILDCLSHETPLDKSYNILSTEDQRFIQHIAMGYTISRLAHLWGQPVEQLNRQEKDILAQVGLSNRLHLIEWAWTY